jgi:hypothetical protein
MWTQKIDEGQAPQEGVAADFFQMYPQTQSGIWVTPRPGVVQSEASAAATGVVESFIYQVAPESGVLELIPPDPAGDGAILQDEMQQDQLPAPVDDWL